LETSATKRYIKINNADKRYIMARSSKHCWHGNATIRSLLLLLV